MNKKVKTILRIISNVLIILVVLFGFLLHGVQLLGLKPYSVLSGSMESVYPTGSLIYVVKADPAKLEVNDIITFKMPSGTIATHRIIELVTDESKPGIVRFRTKGDENNIADGTLVDLESVIGKPVFCIPFLGYLATYIMHPPGKYVAVTVAAALILIEMIISFVLDDKNKKKNDPAQIEHSTKKETSL